MKSVISDLYFETLNELEKIKKTRLLLSERVAYERAVVKLETIKKILNNCTVTPNS